MTEKVESPCISVCQMDDDEHFCIGCFRTRLEMDNWSEFSEEERKKITDQLEERYQNYEDSF